MHRTGNGHTQKYVQAILREKIVGLKGEIDTRDQKVADKGKIVAALQERIELHGKVENLQEKVHAKELAQLQKIIAAQQKTIDNQAERIDILEISIRAGTRKLNEQIRRHAPSQQPIKRSTSCLSGMFTAPKEKTPDSDASTVIPSSVTPLPRLERPWKR